MNISQNEVPSGGNITSLKTYAQNYPDLRKVGQDIYDLLNVPPTIRQAWKKRVVSVDIKPDHLYGSKEVKVVLSVSYDTAVRIMQRMKRSADFAKPRAKKRLLRVKGSDLRAYIHDKLEG
jgi:hypothetical protein